MYGERIDASAFHDVAPSLHDQEALGLFMSQEMQEHAELLLTHSSYAADILRLDRPPERRCHAPIEVMPFGIDERLVVARASERESVIVSLGHLAEVKGLAVLLDAFALLAKDHPEVRLCLAGPGNREELDRWRTRAGQLGLANRVDIPGFLPEAAYERLLQRSTLAVQLRMTSNGEASAAVADCLGAGIPTITTGLGWTFEIAPDALVRVPRDVAPAVLAGKIESLLADPRQRAVMSRGARAYARDSSFDAVAKRYLEVLGVDI
jgi:glycosyltransferase involved in cell wall biosynthesis